MDLFECWKEAVEHPDRKFDTSQPHPAHPDDVAVENFADAMRKKLRQSWEKKDRGGWQSASAAHLTYLLLEHLEKGDPVDVANFAMMLHQNGQRIDNVVVTAYRKAVTTKDDK